MPRQITANISALQRLLRMEDAHRSSIADASTGPIGEPSNWSNNPENGPWGGRANEAGCPRLRQRRISSAISGCSRRMNHRSAICSQLYGGSAGMVEMRLKKPKDAEENASSYISASLYPAA